MRKVKPPRHDVTEQPSLPRLLDEKQAARYLGVSLSYLRKSRSEGAPGGRTPPPPFTKIDGRVYYKVIALDEWVDSLESQRVV